MFMKITENCCWKHTAVSCGTLFTLSSPNIKESLQNSVPLTKRLCKALDFFYIFNNSEFLDSYSM